MSAPPHDAGTHADRLDRAFASLHGLRVGDGLGAQFFLPGNQALLRERTIPSGPWRWTDDTEMACSVLTVLDAHGEIDQDALAASFAEHHDAERGYGPGVYRMLRQLRDEGADWRELSGSLFEGQGSWGNGAAMRVAPLGAWYAGAPLSAAEQAELSARITHQHREAVAGAVAVAVAAALVAMATGTESAAAQPPLNGERLLEEVLKLVPRSAVEAGLHRAVDMLDYGDVGTVAAVLGCGRRTSAHDTVPFTLWAAARHLGGYEQALWTTAQAGGDVDTTCAIVGGIIAAGDPARGDAHSGTGPGAPPPEWAARTEPLPAWLSAGLRTGQRPGQQPRLRTERRERRETPTAPGTTGVPPS